MLLAVPASKVAAPATFSAPESVMAPSLVTSSVPETVDAARSMALLSVSTTSLPETMPTELKSLSALARKMSLAAPAVKVALPVTATAPGPVMAPEVVTSSVPEMVLSASARALMSLTTTLRALVTPSVLKLLAASRVTSPVVPAAKTASPATTSGPLSVMVPVPPVALAVTARLPVMEPALSEMPLVSVMATSSAPPKPTEEKSLAGSARVISNPFATNVALPVTATAPPWVMLPPLVTASVPLSVVVPSVSGVESVSVALLAVRPTLPVKALAVLPRLMSPEAA